MCPEEKQVFIKQAAVAIESGRPVPVGVAAYIGAVLRAFLSGDPQDVSARPGLDSRRGVALEAPLDLAHRGLPPAAAAGRIGAQRQ